MREKIYPIETLNKPFDYVIKEKFKEQAITGAEIGVYNGEHAIGLLTLLPNLRRLYLIDPYESYNDGKLVRLAKIEDEAMNEFKRNILDNEKFNKRVVFIREKSQRAHTYLPDDLDFVYIDGNHTYGFVKKDLEAFYPKVKKGGIFGGDDFLSSRHIGVTFAVKEFSKRNNLNVYSKDYLYETSKSNVGYLTGNEWVIIK